MNNGRQILFLAICILWSNALSSQVLVIRHDTSVTYKKSKMTGKSYRGNKVGLWKELSTDGITYAENWYDSAGNLTANKRSKHINWR